MTQPELARAIATALSLQDVEPGNYFASDDPLPLELIIVSAEVYASWQTGTAKQQSDAAFGGHLAAAAFQLIPVE